MIVKLAILAALGIITGACANSPGLEIQAQDMCAFPKSYLEVDTFDRGAAFAGNPTQPFARRLIADYGAEPPMPMRRADEPISESMLFISGGSQDGAFGAGFLHGWAASRPKGLPRFKVVTGISTGAIMATHALLDRTDVIQDNYRIQRESDILESYLGDASPGSISGALTVVRKGAVGNLNPMRRLLHHAINDEVLKSVAAEADGGRKLYVGAVDVDLGQAVVFHMSEMAVAYREAAKASDELRQDRIRGCYLDAIVASSSVPMAAPPQFIDNRMYIDGGARFGILTDEIGTAAREINRLWETGALKHRTALRPHLYVLINGTITVEPRCGKADTTLCAKLPSGSPIGAHAKWNLLDVAERSLGILINQIYRFSNERIHLRADGNGFKADTQRIGEDIATFKTPVDLPGNGTSQFSCPEWKVEDERLERPKPLEFHPRYMRCLVQYGTMRAQESGWARFE
jgi:hypothetical protein